MREIAYDPKILAFEPAEEVGEPPIEQEIADRLLQEVEDLPHLHRSVVECLVWGNLSKVETARTLGMSRSYVHRLWREAKDILNGRLGNLFD